MRPARPLLAAVIPSHAAPECSPQRTAVADPPLARERHLHAHGRRGRPRRPRRMARPAAGRGRPCREHSPRVRAICGATARRRRPKRARRVRRRLAPDAVAHARVPAAGTAFDDGVKEGEGMQLYVHPLGAPCSKGEDEVSLSACRPLPPSTPPARRAPAAACGARGGRVGGDSPLQLEPPHRRAKMRVGRQVPPAFRRGGRKPDAGVRLEAAAVGDGAFCCYRPSCCDVSRR